MTLTFNLHQEDGRARRGTVHTARGSIETPVFMPVGTAATVKAMMPRDLQAVGTQISLANTYHLHIQPGEGVVEKGGGLHEFMAMDWPVLTDSGGFQVFSLPKKQISEKGVEFAFKKGSETIFASPEWSINIQEALGADIIMAFDECPPYPCAWKDAHESLHRTIRWLDRCVAAQTREDQNLFGIVQGSTFDDLRAESACETIQRDLPGYAIGGVSVGEGHGLMMQAVDGAEPYLPKHRPRYLMGVGLPEDIVGAVGRGMDMFDCVIPTRYARSGTIFSWRGRFRVTHSNYRNDQYPLEPNCDCYACENFTRSYIHHLVRSDELLGTMLCTLHNLRFYHSLMERIREAIAAEKYADFVAWFEDGYLRGDRKMRREEFRGHWYDSFEIGYARQRFGEAGDGAATSGPSGQRVRARSLPDDAK